MDLRPKIVAEIVESIFDELGWSEEARVGVRQKWRDRGLEKFTCHSLPVRNVSSNDPTLVEGFLKKYPALRRIAGEACATAKRVWPEADLELELMSDPESCHICHEGQHLVLKVYRDRPDKWEDDFAQGNPRLAYFDWWYDFQENLRNEDREVSNLFMEMLSYKPEQ